VTLFRLEAVESTKPAFVDDLGREMTYGGLDSLCDEIGQLLEPQRVAAVFTRNTIGCVSICVALLQNGVVPLLLDETSDESVIRRYFDLYEPEYVVRPVERVVDLTGLVPLTRVHDDVLLARRSSAMAFTHPDLALLLSTSGSTGSPKVVRQSRENLRSNGEAIAASLGIGADDRPITSLPLHYTYGFSVLNSHLRRGATLLVTASSVLEKQFWKFFAEEGATSLAGVPYTYQMLQRLRFQNMDLPTLRSITQAGGKMSTALIQEFGKFALSRGVKFFVMYGQTEATARMSLVSADRILEKAGSIGVPIPGGKFFLVDKQGHLVDSHDEVGELCYRGPNVAMGYAESRADLTKGDEWGGVLRTGDLARFDTDGFFYITGRLTRFAKVFGKRVSLDDVEHLCSEYVADAACGSGDDKIVVWTTDAERSPDLRRLLAERTNLHPSAFDVRTVAAIPRTASGKLDYKSLEGSGDK
jgi:long-chain acyl-CoA synthetase